jgi:hypothetical protein
MRTIGISIGHDDDFAVFNIFNIEALSKALTNGINDGSDFFIMD